MTKGTDTRQAVRQRLYTRGKKRGYYIDLRDLGGGREALKPHGEKGATTDELVALDLAAKRIAELEARKRGLYFGELKRTATLGSFVHEWLTFRRSLATVEGFTGERTLRRYEQALQNLFSVVDEDVRIDRFTKADAKQAIARMAQLPSRSGGTLKAASLNQAYVAMRQVFEHAADEGVVPQGHNPWRALRRTDRPRLPKSSTTDFLEVFEAAALLEACPRVTESRLPLKEIVAALLLTGGRKTEVLGLEIGDIDFKRQVIHIRPNRWRPIKTKERRTVPLWPQLEEILQPYIAARGLRAGLLFPSEDSDEKRQVMITAPNKAIKQAHDIAADLLGGDRGVAFRRKKVTPRAMRTTYCSARLQTLDNGKPIALFTVYGEMGHSGRKMVDEVYGRLGTIRHRSEVVEYRPGEGDGVPSPPSRKDSTELNEGQGTQGETGAEAGGSEAPSRPEGQHSKHRARSHPTLPVSDSFRPGRIRLAQFLADACVSKGTFMETHRRDAELMRRLDVHMDHGGRLHFPEGAGRELRAIRDRQPYKKPYKNRGQPTGRRAPCVACNARVPTRSKSCPRCGLHLSAKR